MFRSKKGTTMKRVAFKESVVNWSRETNTSRHEHIHYKKSSQKGSLPRVERKRQLHFFEMPYLRLLSIMEQTNILGGYHIMTWQCYYYCMDYIKVSYKLLFFFSFWMNIFPFVFLLISKHFRKIMQNKHFPYHNPICLVWFSSFKL